MDDKEKAQQTFEAGGLLAEEDDQIVRITLAIDPKEPMKIFDKLIEFELDLVRQAGNDIERVMRASEFVDNIRKVTREQLEKAGIEVTV